MRREHTAAAFHREAVPTLTRRERQIVDLLLEGCTNKMIAKRLGTSDKTVKNQLTTLYEKAGVHNRLELVAKFHAVKSGDVRVAEP